MTKDEVNRLLGDGNASETARLIGITRQSFNSWPDGRLPQRLVDRVQAALWRKTQGIATPSNAENIRSTDK